MKRFRAPKAKPGELKVAYGKHEGDLDIFYCHGGEGAARCDARMVASYFEGLKGAFERNMKTELMARGYDITTIKFSIQQKKK